MVERDNDRITGSRKLEVSILGKTETRNIEEARIEVTDGEVGLYVILELPFFFRSCYFKSNSVTLI